MSRAFWLSHRLALCERGELCRHRPIPCCCSLPITPTWITLAAQHWPLVTSLRISPHRAGSVGWCADRHSTIRMDADPPTFSTNTRFLTRSNAVHHTTVHATHCSITFSMAYRSHNTDPKRSIHIDRPPKTKACPSSMSLAEPVDFFSPTLF